MRQLHESELNAGDGRKKKECQLEKESQRSDMPKCGGGGKEKEKRKDIGEKEHICTTLPHHGSIYQKMTRHVITKL